MRIIYIIFMFIIGCILGSFYNVVGYRVPRKLSIIKPDSFCPKCKNNLKWYELIPIFSYLFQLGRCRTCGNKISVIYPMIEITTGILFATSYFVFGFSYQLLIATITSSFMMVVMVSDINYLIIPDSFTIIFSIFIIIAKLIFEGVWITSISILSGTFLFLIMYLIMCFGNILLKKESLGGADIKLMFFVGLVIGPGLGLFSIFLSSFMALPLSLVVYLKNKDNVIPYGPFILMSAFVIYLFQINSNFLLNLI